uniref:Putative calcium-binding protein CML35 n=1 Tax=Anthurium amnicola TaxID=1678845 RepID=A0A1D1XKY3_9ARAE
MFVAPPEAEEMRATAFPSAASQTSRDGRKARSQGNNMEPRLFSCLSFLWPEKDTTRDSLDGAASPRESSSWDDLSSPLLRRINDPNVLRRILHRLGDGGTNPGGQISLSRLLLPLRLHRPDQQHSTTEDEDDDDDDVGGGGGEEDERLMAIEDVIAAVTEAGSPECVESLISAFEFYDRDGDGVISGSDLVLALRDAVGGGEGSEVPSAAACQEMVAAFDWGRAGGLCFDDFLRMMMVSDSCSSSGHQTDEQGT